MGLAIDYALFMVSRFREELAQAARRRPGRRRRRRSRHHDDRRPHRPVLRPHRRRGDVARCWCSRRRSSSSMGYGGIAAVVIAMLAALTVLPATPAPARPADRRRPAAVAPAPPVAVDSDHGCLGPAGARRDAPSGRGHRRSSRRSCSRVASPFLGVKWGSVDYRVLPSDAPAHIAADKLERGVRRRSGPAPTCSSPAPTSRTSRRTPSEIEDGRRHRRRPAGRDGGRQHAAAGVWDGNSQTEASQDMVARPARRSTRPRARCWSAG